MEHFAKGAIRTFKNYAIGYSDTQVKMREATSNNPWGPSGTQMSEIAQLTFNQGDFVEIVEMLDKRLNDRAKNWKHVYKSQAVLDYCLHVGSENFVTYFRDNLYIVKALKEFQYIDEKGQDQGTNVRQKANELTNLLEDESRLWQERLARAPMNDKLKSANNRQGMDFSREAQQEEWERLAEETDMQRALKLSQKEKEVRQANIEESNESRELQDDVTGPPPEYDKELSAASLILPGPRSGQVSYPATFKRFEKVAENFDSYKPILRAIQSDLECDWDRVFGELVTEWKSASFAHLAVAGVNGAIYTISTDAVFRVDTQQHAKNINALIGLSAAGGLALSYWHLYRYRSNDVEISKRRACDPFGGYLFFFATSQLPTLLLYSGVLFIILFLMLAALQCTQVGTIVFLVLMVSFVLLGDIVFIFHQATVLLCSFYVYCRGGTTRSNVTTE